MVGISNGGGGSLGRDAAHRVHRNLWQTFLYDTSTGHAPFNITRMFLFMPLGRASSLDPCVWAGLTSLDPCYWARLTLTSCDLHIEGPSGQGLPLSIHTHKYQACCAADPSHALLSKHNHIAQGQDRPPSLQQNTGNRRQASAHGLFCKGPGTQ
eukprot:1014903-Pelagomonas_calceolata.AAC.6